LHAQSNIPQSQNDFKHKYYLNPIVLVIAIKQSLLNKCKPYFCSTHRFVGWCSKYLNNKNIAEDIGFFLIGAVTLIVKFMKKRKNINSMR